MLLHCYPQDLFAERGGPLVGHLDPLDVGGVLGVDPVQCLVLPHQRRVHVVGHVPDVAHHGAHLEKQEKS